MKRELITNKTIVAILLTYPPMNLINNSNANLVNVKQFVSITKLS